MDFKSFKDCFFSHLAECDDSCFSDISSNEKIIKEFLQENDSKNLKSFIAEFNNIIINSDNKRKFDFYEKVLKIESLNDVLEGFRESDILIRACKNKDTKLIKWLLTMNINSCVQDEEGMTALMVASEDSDLLFVVKELLKQKTESLNFRDRDGRTALFHSINNKETLRLLLDTADCNPNILDKNKDSVITYCCRNKVYDAVKTLSSKDTVDVNIFNNEEKTAAIYLMEEGRYSEIGFLINDKINFCYENEKHESAWTIFFKKFYEYYREKDMTSLIPYIKIMKVLVDKNISLNVSIDEEGNTPMMFFTMIEDWNSLSYIILYSQNFDLSLKNKNGESVGTILMKQKPTKISYRSEMNISNLLKYIFSHPTFDATFHDDVGNNVLMNYIIFSEIEINITEILKSHKEYVTGVNQHDENLLIIAVKFGRRDIIRPIITGEGCDINHQDEMGNTALHYAVMINDYFIVNCLAYYHADINIKNKEGKSPMNLVNESGDSTMSKFILKPCNSHDFQKIEERSQAKSLFNFGEKHKFRELNENLRSKYQESHREEIQSQECKYKYQPNRTINCDTEYYSEAFPIYFPIKLDLYRRGQIELESKLRDLINVKKDIIIDHKYKHQLIV